MIASAVVLVLPNVPTTPSPKVPIITKSTPTNAPVVMAMSTPAQRFAPWAPAPTPKIDSTLKASIKRLFKKAVPLQEPLFFTFNPHQKNDTI
jgi:hypothetical protein